jgi:hypothetical protein
MSQELVRLKITDSTASGHRKGWLKQVTSVDKTKVNGDAFAGDFLREGVCALPLGAIVVEQFPTGSVKNGVDKGEAYRVETSGLVSFATADDWRRNFLDFRDAVAAALELPSPGTSHEEKRAALQQEKSALLLRLDSIEYELKNL